MSVFWLRYELGRVFGYLVKSTGSYNVPLIPMVFMFILSALMWLRIDPTEQLIPESLPALQ
jgi:MFS transporter, ACS family, glucarate transporter